MFRFHGTIHLVMIEDIAHILGTLECCTFILSLKKKQFHSETFSIVPLVAPLFKSSAYWGERSRITSTRGSKLFGICQKWETVFLTTQVWFTLISSFILFPFLICDQGRLASALTYIKFHFRQPEYPWRCVLTRILEIAAPARVVHSRV